jgi:hypothetical protein
MYLQSRVVDLLALTGIRAGDVQCQSHGDDLVGSNRIAVVAYTFYTHISLPWSPVRLPWLLQAMNPSKDWDRLIELYRAPTKCRCC